MNDPSAASRFGFDHTCFVAVDSNLGRREFRKYFPTVTTFAGSASVIELAQGSPDPGRLPAWHGVTPCQ